MPKIGILTKGLPPFFISARRERGERHPRGATEKGGGEENKSGSFPLAATSNRRKEEGGKKEGRPAAFL